MKIVFSFANLLMISSMTCSMVFPPPLPISLPVYSLSVPYVPSTTTAVTSHVKTSMNIVTYATAASVAPPKLWTVSLYTNTLTHHAFFYGSDMIPSITESNQTRWGILQLLSKHQTALVHILGKHSGFDKAYHKEVECMNVGYPWVYSCMKQSEAFITYHTLQQQELSSLESTSVQVLPRCQAYLLLAYTGQYMNAGDHDVALCQVIDTGVWTVEETTDSIKSAGHIQWASSIAADPLKTWDGSTPKDETVVLYTGYLRSQGLL